MNASPAPRPIFDDANDTVDALVQAEAFVAGFEGDPQQTGVADILAGLRAAIDREQSAPAALDAILTPKLFHVAVNRVEVSPDEMRQMLVEIYDIARAAIVANIAQAEGR